MQSLVLDYNLLEGFIFTSYVYQHHAVINKPESGGNSLD